MEFRVVRSVPTVEQTELEAVYLWNTGWDDWFSFATHYGLLLVDSAGKRHRLGEVKIGQVGLRGAKAGTGGPKTRTPELPSSFRVLSEEYFSLGQDDSYYGILNDLGADVRLAVLAGLRDIAYSADARRVALSERVTTTSLLRNVTLRTVEDQFARMAHGGARLTDFSFTFRPSGADGASLDFAVVPHSRPPTNIHVIIGRNGVGKSTLLNRLGDTMVRKSRASDSGSGPWRQLANVVFMSFSVFDDFKPAPTIVAKNANRTRGLTHHYVGLKKMAAAGGEVTTKDDKTIRDELAEGLRICIVGARRTRLAKALNLLENDPMFAEARLSGILGLSDEESLAGEAEGPGGRPTPTESAISAFINQFRRLSSGHKIVLLSMVKLVETVEEKSLVLLDEPESHLHPPLLSAFTRALSDLLMDRNGMAVIATHSPVVLQEVPKGCVWKMSRSGDNMKAERPRIETFGENVGVLTEEVFGLEVTSTGFHRLLHDAAISAESYEQALASFEGEIGSEGRAILRAMVLEAAKHVDS